MHLAAVLAEPGVGVSSAAAGTASKQAGSRLLCSESPVDAAARLAHRAACLEAGTTCRIQMPPQARLIVHTAGYIDFRTVRHG